MTEGYRFREVRKGEREAVLGFAEEQGLAAKADALRHDMSLVVTDEQGQTAAAALCMSDERGRLVVEIVTRGAETDPALASELADRCLRKVQACAVGSARLHSPAKQPAESILSDANWLDSILETPPAEAATSDVAHADEAAQAA